MSQCRHCSTGEDHSHDSELGVEYSLYTKIDTYNVQCLNEAEDGSGKSVFKPWEERLNFEKCVISDVDEELLFNIPFTGNVKLKGIIIIGGENGSHPSSQSLSIFELTPFRYKNRPRMTFDETSAIPDQQFELTHDTQGINEYPIKAVKFSSVNHLSIYFPANFGDESTKIYYIGLKGEFTPAQRDALLIANYELAPNPADHKTKNIDSVTHQIH
ncbi:hypothetical protein B4U80_05821 [Leptotrombidium deliense]|uniref:PITH domain-containing protein n=1 Tax=Leptotrombidium deliense TaxID=299467 RepID=A0A443SM92_9ACAR|nr:hypothetical protein B4U80_05821 [Leptotrombidium deliense]